MDAMKEKVQQEALQREILKREVLQQEVENLKARLRLEQQQWEAERLKKVQEVVELTKQLREVQGQLSNRRETHTSSEAPNTHKEVSKSGKIIKVEKNVHITLNSSLFAHIFRRIRSTRLTPRDFLTLATRVTSTR